MLAEVLYVCNTNHTHDACKNFLPMKKKYLISYDFYDAKAEFVVDTDVFTPEKAQEYLDRWEIEHNPKADPIGQVLRSHFDIMLRSGLSHDLQKAKDFFKNDEVLHNLDGTQGITLIDLDPYKFHYELIEVFSEDLES